MAITAAITLTSGANDLVTDALALSTSASLTKAGTSTALSNTTGLARRSTTTAVKYTLLRADDYSSDKSQKVYMKNTSTVVAEYFTITVGDQILGRLYAGDWAMFPWAAVDGTKEQFTVTFADTWALNDIFVFDGITVTATGSNVTTQVADLVSATFFPNWTVTNSSGVCTFVAKYARADQEIDTSEATVTTAGDGSGAVATTVTGLHNADNIYITPGQATNTIEYMAFYE